ncbi:protein-export chaperone SecB [Thermophagus xiamenensis]|jgi:preprotein translocase subunit SecB|uniref:Preprotein translocase subunit SecB n=1 Tax=Thermophagus xiamenensis TaxID=385682 RepID=A0A1I2D2G0_9BACT|nr:protein-export chaperone SecB [Thermophagus xiamenensis]SFE74737.1 Preprotein translocase subunit SecB [Thermophagus xiamenensis]
MLAKPSEIQLKNFAVLQSHYKFTPLKKLHKNIYELIDGYQIDIDFAHQAKKKGEIQVFTKISVNNTEAPLPGYSLFIEGSGIFLINEVDRIERSVKDNLKYYSTVSIMIGYLRNSLSNMTASAPLGPYILPPIDLKDLFRKKNEQAKSFKK